MGAEFLPQLTLVDLDLLLHFLRSDAHHRQGAVLGRGEAFPIVLVDGLQLRSIRFAHIDERHCRHEDRLAATLLVTVAIEAVDQRVGRAHAGGRCLGHQFAGVFLAEDGEEASFVHPALLEELLEAQAVELSR